MKTIKKFAAVALSLTLGLTALTGCGAKKTEVKTIGISQYGEHASLDN